MDTYLLAPTSDRHNTLHIPDCMAKVVDETAEPIAAQVNEWNPSCPGDAAVQFLNLEVIIDFNVD